MIALFGQINNEAMLHQMRDVLLEVLLNMATANGAMVAKVMGLWCVMLVIQRGMMWMNGIDGSDVADRIAAARMEYEFRKADMEAMREIYDREH